jgi:hypothetical protein
MENKTDEEHLDNTTIPNNETEPINPNQETENMETHAQHLHNAPGKGIWHYFYEFLMLFLAVFFGFLAEYQLEHVIERDKEKQYISSLIEDLKVDTLIINIAINARLLRETRLDSLIVMIKLKDHNKFTNEIYFLARFVSRQNFFFVNADRTMQQLKYSGALRLIRNNTASNDIMSYDASIRFLQYRESIESPQLINYRNTVENIFDASVFRDMLKGNVIIRPAGNPKLFNDDPNAINRLCIEAHYLFATSLLNRGYEAEIKHSAETLIAFLEKEYNLE